MLPSPTRSGRPPLLPILISLPLIAIGQAAWADEALSPADYQDEARLAQLIWDRAPEVLEARQQSQVAASEVTRAHLYPNPQLDLGWGTIPVGRTNPANLSDPVGNIPNYSVGLSELFELAKRGPRQNAAAAEREAASAQARAIFADKFFDLLTTIGHIAMNEERAAMLDHEVGEGDRLLNLDRARADKGEIARMSVDRSEAEQLRLIAERDEARTELESARADCATVLAATCPAFGSEEAARAYLDRGGNTSLPAEWSTDIAARRPDLAALDAALQAADERVTLAKRQAIPDLTVRFGYTYDTFVASGAQRQSLGLGVQMPLPIADHGQADLEAASAALTRARRARDALTNSGRLTLEASSRRRALVRDRLTQLQTAGEKADVMRSNTEGAAREGGASQVDVLLARRRYQEVLLQRTQLDFDLYDAALDARRAAALFPTPADFPQEASVP